MQPVVLTNLANLWIGSATVDRSGRTYTQIGADPGMIVPRWRSGVDQHSGLQQFSPHWVLPHSVSLNDQRMSTLVT